MGNLLITICARAGSKGVEGKNIRKLAGKPLLSYTIKQAIEWGRGKRVIVSTDTEEIAQVARKYGAEVPFLRPKKLAGDKAIKEEAIRHALQTAEEFFKEKYDYVMDLDATAPVRTTKDLQKAFNLFRKEKPKTLFSVVPARRNPYFNMVEEIAGKRVAYSKPNTNIHRRQDAPKVYDMNASIYIYSRDYLLNEKNNKPVTDNSVAYIMHEHSRHDIDSEIDFKFIEFLIKEKIISL